MQSLISDRCFLQVRDLFCDITGIHLSDSKKQLITSRLQTRLRHHQLDDFEDYYIMLTKPGHLAELQVFTDLLTTNETYFFREPESFGFLAKYAAARKPSDELRVWSAACSTGEEAYSIAMTLDKYSGTSRWNILASDISSRVLEQAKTGRYRLARMELMPKRYLNDYCLKGISENEGLMQIKSDLKERVSFQKINLIHDFSDQGPFDVIFLRNVLIYFDLNKKMDILMGLLDCLKPAGYLIVGLSEGLGSVMPELVPVAPAIYRKLAKQHH